MLFFDLVSAFYRVLRQLSMDMDCSDEDIARLLAQLGIPPQVMHDIAEKMKNPIFKQMDILSPMNRIIIQSPWWYRPKQNYRVNY